MEEEAEATWLLPDVATGGKQGQIPPRGDFWAVASCCEDQH
jgi:hypothetical protein